MWGLGLEKLKDDTGVVCLPGNLQGETHFFAAVVKLENRDAEKNAANLEQMRSTGTLTPEAEAALRLMSTRKGLVEMGVIREKLARAEMLQPHNVDVEALRKMARLIATECGLPSTTAFCATNPVQLFDFSSLARCEVPLKLLHGNGQVTLGTKDQAAQAASGTAGTGLVCPIGDALQEPLWTSGLGINRGFHSGLNAVYGALLHQHRGLPAACVAMDAAWARMLAINWPSGLAGEGSKGIVQPGQKWCADPASRL